ncbi:hypothetical protein RSAG8_07584, partial [Rhizoctonia solani AG-8 WAC10335]
MISPTIPLTTPSITQWEEAGASLANALGKYLELCISLGTNSLEERAHPNNLVERIDSKLNSLHSILDRQIAQARSVLSKTRNEIASPIQRLPEDVLVEVFTLVIYSPPNATHDGVAKMEKHLLKLYRWIHALRGVCSRWQRVILGRGYFWSMIPIFQAPKPAGFIRSSRSQELQTKYRQAMSVSLERARGCCLDIAILGSTFPSEYFDILEGHLPQIRTINILGSKRGAIRGLMDTILQGSIPPSSLLELSIYIKPSEEFYRRPPGVDDYIYHPESPNCIRFNELLQSLPVLRINGAHMHWDALVFSNRLPKLRLQAINFGSDRTMVDCLHHALASATGLREFEVVSVKSTCDINEALPPFVTPISPISLPNLESLLVVDLCRNTLLFLLTSIVSRSHRLTLHFTQICRYFNVPSEPGWRTDGYTELLQQALKQISVHRLCIHASFKATAEELRTLLESVPMLDTLLLNETEFTTEHCNALERLETQGNEPHSFSFPCFQCLCFSRAKIQDMVAFKSMVASHSQSMEHLILGGHTIPSLPDSDGRSSSNDKDMYRDQGIISQFREIVPHFILMDSKYVPTEFQHHAWQLW